LTDAKTLSEKDARDLLTDVASTHQAALGQSANPSRHHAVIAIVETHPRGQKWRPSLTKEAGNAAKSQASPCALAWFNSQRHGSRTHAEDHR
jgi:hypothetical protein